MSNSTCKWELEHFYGSGGTWQNEICQRRNSSMKFIKFRSRQITFSTNPVFAKFHFRRIPFSLKYPKFDEFLFRWFFDSFFVFNRLCEPVAINQIAYSVDFCSVLWLLLSNVGFYKYKSRCEEQRVLSTIPSHF